MRLLVRGAQFCACAWDSGHLARLCRENTGRKFVGGALIFPDGVAHCFS